MPALSSLPDASIYGSIQPPKAMSLQEMVDLGRTSTALQREKALLPSAIEMGQAQARTAVTQADTTQLDNALRHTTSAIQTQQQLLTKPNLTSDDVVTATKEHAKRFGSPESSVNQALANLPVNGTPAQLREWLATNLAKTLSAQTQLEKMYPGGILPSQLPESGYQTNRQTTEPSATAPATAPATVPKAGVQAQDMSQPVKSEFSKPVPLAYQVRQAGQAYTALPQEETDRKVGTEFRNNLVSRLPNMATERRNIDETIEVAEKLEKSSAPTSGILGAAYRKVATWAGDPTYYELSKNLAQTTLSNMQALGLRTDADKNLSSAANGDYTYPPETLIKIAQRAKADMHNIEMQAAAAEKFSQKFGDNNMNAFKQMWSNNADTKIFQAMNIFNDPKLSAEEKAKARDKLLGTDPKQIKIFNEKYKNINKLVQTGTL
jgi:hypothetical protein